MPQEITNITKEELLEAMISYNKDYRENPEKFDSYESTQDQDIVEVSIAQANYIINKIKQQRKNEKSSL